jgi:type II secretory ATPase GspE/PulE/Tfp pilus assembly ATPase PilB-like protein
VVAQALYIDDEIRFMIEQGLIHEIFLKVQQRDAAGSMRADAARLVQEGVISIGEALRVVG